MSCHLVLLVPPGEVLLDLLQLPLQPLPLVQVSALGQAGQTPDFAEKLFSLGK